MIKLKKEIEKKNDAPPHSPIFLRPCGLFVLLLACLTFLLQKQGKLTFGPWQDTGDILI